MSITNLLGTTANAAQIFSVIWTLIFGGMGLVELWKKGGGGKLSPGLLRNLIMAITTLLISSTLAFFLNGNIVPGVHSNIQPTATAQAQRTPTPTIEPSQKIYVQATSGTPVLSDPLSHQDSYKWDESANCAFVGGAYHISSSLTDNFFTCALDNQPSNLGNLAFQVQATIIHGDYEGMYFRSNEAGTGDYTLTIDSYGQYSLIVYKDNEELKTVIQGHSSAFKTGLNQSNLITVIARGRNFYLYINGQFLPLGSDINYSTGGIGLLAGDTTHSTEVAFSNLKVWSL